MNPVEHFAMAMQRLPLVAILRGLPPQDALATGQAIADAGWHVIEVPLNSPRPLESIARLAEALPQIVVGAGTVLRAEQVLQVHKAGGRLVVAPNFDAEVVRAAVDLGMACVPGVMTPSEAFAALDAGAHALKLFPAEMIPPDAVKAMRAVLPESVRLLPVGGIDAGNMAAYRAAGASGFGLGSSLYRPGDAADLTRERAFSLAAAWHGRMHA